MGLFKTSNYTLLPTLCSSGLRSSERPALSSDPLTSSTTVLPENVLLISTPTTSVFALPIHFSTTTPATQTEALVSRGFELCLVFYSTIVLSPDDPSLDFDHHLLIWVGNIRGID